MLITTNMKFGKLYPKETTEVNPGSHKKILCICDCGKEAYIEIRRLLSSKIKSCGQCNLISAKNTDGKWFGNLTIETPQDISSGSTKKIGWICKCGNKALKQISYVVSGRTKSCGQCNLISAKDIFGKWFGDLTMEIPQDVIPGSLKRIKWVCKCGRKVLKRISCVLSGETTCCGECNSMTAEEMKDRQFGDLKIETPQNILFGSGKKIGWICKCGNRIITEIYSVTHGYTKSCGKCNEISAEEMKIRKFGKLKMKNPRDIKPGSKKKEWWLCDCGKEKLACIKSVVSGYTICCGKCNLITAEEISTKKFGKLRIKVSQEVLPGSVKKILCICDCGNETNVVIARLFSGDTTSCGKCDDKIKSWYLINKSKLLSLKFPIKPNEFPTGGIISLEPVLNTGKPFKAKCSICGNTHYPRFGDIVRNNGGLTCGCLYNRVSMAQKEITEFIRSLNLKAINEYQVNKLKYDIFVPSHNLLIEYNGLKWHSYQRSKSQDTKKYDNAVSNGFEYLMVFEDEWKNSQLKVKSLLLNKLNLTKPQVIRPSKCEVRVISSQEANLFHEQFHYIGKCSPKLSYGVYYQNNLIACISFAHTTRQSKHPWELVRMTSNPEFKIHGIWSKLFKRFILEQNPTSLVSFSDNRLFSGKVYEKIGFKSDHTIPSDYYWVKGRKRFHKSALRKTKAEKLTGLTETQLREAQGYKKIWDLGKKCWVYEPGVPI